MIIRMVADVNLFMEIIWARDLTVGCFDTTFLAIFDQFRSTMVASTPLNKTTTLMLPLESISDSQPLNHWAMSTSRHSFRVDHFFRFDRNITCLEVVPLYDAPLFPGLARRLQRDLHQETLCISLWSRQCLSLLKNILVTLMSTPYLTAFLKSQHGQLCGAEHEDILHLVITCPFKTHVWQQTFKHFAPFTEFSASRLHELVFSLQRFQLVNNEALYVLASKVIRSIWRYHWQFFFDGVPLQTDLVLQ
ncbi:hypothetical protein K501DRAFT_337251 [Backusella circina FSU 941]|nr:hypothetical protein K501DRAFT_337251 [Backusella circina FSU 941]